MIWLTAPAWFVAAIEILGEWRFEKGQGTARYSINLGAWYNPLATIAFALLAMAPFLIAFGGSRLGTKNELHERIRTPKLLILFFALSLLVSLLSCLWTCSGHPTWTNGYTQH